jgi:hypothetical protein
MMLVGTAVSAPVIVVAAMTVVSAQAAASLTYGTYSVLAGSVVERVPSNTGSEVRSPHCVVTPLREAVA